MSSVTAGTAGGVSHRVTMSADSLYNRVLSYFEEELAAARERMERGQFATFKDQILTGRRLADALALLSPYARGDRRARRLVKSGEALLNELMSVREVIRKKNSAPGERQTLLMFQILTGKEYLQ